MIGKTSAILTAAALTLTLTSCGSEMAAQDDIVHNSRMAVKKYTTAVDNGRYRANSDGSVWPGNSQSAKDMEKMGDDMKQGTEKMMRDAKNAMDDLGNSAKDAAQDVRRNVDRAADDLSGR